MTKIQCKTENCFLPALEYTNGEVIAFNEHRGKKHVNRIAVEKIIRLAQEDGTLERILEKTKKAC